MNAMNAMQAANHDVASPQEHEHGEPEGTSEDPDPQAKTASKPDVLRAWAKQQATGDVFTNALRAAEPGGTPGIIRVPLPVASRAEYVQQVKGKGVFKRAEKTKPTDVPIEGLNAIQRTLNVERLSKYADDPDAVEKGTRASGHGGLVDKPVIVQVGGKRYIHDGHHRIAARKMSGATSVQARIVDLDNDTAGDE